MSKVELDISMQRAGYIACGASVSPLYVSLSYVEFFNV